MQWGKIQEKSEIQVYHFFKNLLHDQQLPL